MRIGIDISQVVYEGTGVAAYTTNLVDNLVRIDQNNDYSLFGSSLRQKKKLIEFASKICTNDLNHCRTSIWPLPPMILDTLWNRLHVLPVESLLGNIDVFHSSDWIQPPTKARKVTTIHDLVVFKFPELLHPRIVAVQRRRLAWVKRECDLVIAVSQATKKDIVRILEIPEDKIRVVYEATSPEFDDFYNLTDEVKARRVDGIRARYKLPKGYLLMVGTREPRKNLKGTIQAFSSLNNKDLELVIVGNFGWGEDMNETRGVRLLGFVPNQDLPALYHGAVAFIYPSLYEGFGLPVLEAFYCGCPVIASNVSSLPEVGGRAAIYVDPQDSADIAEKINWSVRLDTRSRKKMVAAGYQQASKFSWERAAAETKSIYEELG